MSEVSIAIGKKLHTFRKIKKMTLDDLSQVICKSKSTLSKYEKGEIALDIETLYELAEALQIHVEQLLYTPAKPASLPARSDCPAFLTA
jgi:transcriptional regulator with XRE-family HTH domain